MTSNSPAPKTSARKIDRRRFLLAGSAVASATAFPVPLRFAAGQESALVPAGQAVVTSLRTPVTALSTAQLQAIIDGQIVDWIDAGSPVAGRIELIALEGTVPFSRKLRYSAASYEELVVLLTEHPNGLAMVPAKDIDFRVNVLAVDGFDPLRHAPVDGKESISVAVVGDIVPGRNVHNKMLAYGDFSHPFRKIAAELRRADVTIANLEGNLSSTILPPGDAHTYSFVSDPAMIDGLKLAGIDAVSLANNHSRWNANGWGDAALLDTMDALSAAGMNYFGAGRSLTEARASFVAEVQGERLAFLGVDGVTANLMTSGDEDAPLLAGAAGPDSFSGATADAAGTNPYLLDQVIDDVTFLAGEFDIVIPYLHLGEEYIAIPPQWALDGARAAIDAGATMVVTNHPHVIQGMEIYKGKPIIYSVGNFIFDQMFSIDVRQGMILEVLIRDRRVVGLRPKGVEIEDFNQPRLMDTGEHASLMNRFWWATDRIASIDN